MRLILTGLPGLTGRVRSMAKAADVLPMPKILDVAKASIRREFATQTWAGPYGDRPWPARKDFGTRVPSSPPLGGTLAAWMAAGRTTPKTVEMRLGGKAGTIASFHRGGSQSSLLAAAGFSIIKAKRPAKQSKYGPNHPAYYAMWHFLRLTYGVTLKLETLLGGIKVPHRKHATRNPRMTAEAAEIIREHFREAARAVAG